jgi:tetratricopeptide (TPR) repeat protein
MAYAHRAKALVHLSRFREALSDFTEAIKLDDQRYDVWLGRGLVHYSLNRRREAIDDLTRAETFEEGRNDVLLYISRAEALRDEGKIDEAVRDLRKAIDIAPEAALPQIVLAQTMVESGSMDEARILLGDARKRASAGDLATIAAIEEYIESANGDLTQAIEFERVFKVFLNARSIDEMRQAVVSEPLLSNSIFIDLLDQRRQQLSGEEAQAIEERLSSLRQIVFNPAQLAFVAVMAAGSRDELRAALSEHPLLRDRTFLDRLSEVAGEIPLAEAAAHLKEMSAALRDLVEGGG